MDENYNAGDSTRITREYLDSLLVEMRHIDAVESSTEFKLYGKTFSTPVMMAALSPQSLVEVAKGFHAAGSLAWAGKGGFAELEEIRTSGIDVIKILKPLKDKEEILKTIEQVEKIGCLAVGFDIDSQFGTKNKLYETGGISVAPKSVKEIREFVDATSLPFIIKGVLSEQDVYKCLDAGVRGIVISHHHGVVDYALPPLRILPKIAAVVRKQIPVFVDCSINRGMDAFKALALGADAVCLGRSILNPLKEKGAEGVQKLVEQVTNELKWAMAVTCSPDISHIDPSIIWSLNR
jgi:isopentenyl diphosphate isomerase/L-lactate dehydrogenase-like FMN-dependent dehydrogenase